MNVPVSDVLVPLIVFSAMFGAFYVHVTARHRQRMAMIEKGMDPGNFSKATDGGFNNLRNGLLMLGVGLGLFLGYLVARVMPSGSNSYDPDPDNPLPYFMMVLLCGGAALVIHHFIVRRKMRE
jgi:hypothetical protein